MDLTLPIAAPSLKGTREKRVVIGFFPADRAIGNEFLKAHVRFDDGVLLHYVCDALVYSGNELSIGGREYVRKKGEELWIVSFRTKENPRDGLVHGDTPNVKLRGSPASGRVPLECKVMHLLFRSIIPKKFKFI